MSEKVANKVIEIVSSECNIPMEDLFSRTRKKEVVYPRQLAQTILVKRGYSEKHVATIFGQHRTTIYNSVASIAGWEVSSKEKRHQIAEISEMIN